MDRHAPIQLEIVGHDKDMLVVFPMGTFPGFPKTLPKPRLGIGLDGDKPALFMLAEGTTRDAGETCIGHLPVETLDFYFTCENILCVEADPITDDVAEHGWARAVHLFERHIHRNKS